MDNNEELLDFSLDDILKEFHDDSAVSESDADLSGLDALLSTPAESHTKIPHEAVPEESAAPAEYTPVPEADAPSENADSAIDGTRRLDVLPHKEAPAEASDAPTAELPDLNAARRDEPADAQPAAEAEAVPEQAQENAESEEPEEEQKEPIPFDPRAHLHEMKRKLIAGPEKLYYELSEKGVLKLQIAIIINVVILGLSVAASTLYALDMIPESRMKLLIFSQALAMLGSGLLGCYLMLDGLEDLLHFRFSTNTILAFSFLACCADVFFCIRELRVPCCAAFSLEMIMALLACYHKRSTRLAQLDTMRKAVKLTSIVKEPDFYEGKTGILRGLADVEDFVDTMDATPTPEKVQNAFAFIAFIVCIGIAALAGILHSVSLAVQIFATSLLVAVPAGYFASLTRPAALLQNRLHMVGSVICGWQGVRKLCGKAVFPVTDSDLFPVGSTKLNGVKFYSDRDSGEVVSYTASLISAAGGGLVGVFRNLLASRNGQIYPVENFQDYGDGGIGGEINGEPVLLGTLNFLQDMGVEIPQGTMVNQAVYAAIDGQLAAVIAISYAKMRSAAAGLVSLNGSWRVKPLLMAGDFMLTEDFIRSKFSLRGRKLIVPDREVRAELAKKTVNPDSDVLAIATRDDLISFVYTVTGASALRTACRLGNIIHILGGILGILIMLALAYIGSDTVLTPTNVLLYQLVWLIPGFLASEWTRHV